MGFLNQLAIQVKEIYGRLTLSQKVAFVLLVALVVVIMVGFTSWGTRPDFVQLTAQPTDARERAAALTALQGVGIEAREQGGVIQVPQSQQSRAMAVLAESGALPPDYSGQLRLEDVGTNGSMWESPQERRARRELMLQNWLASVIQHMDGIAQATVAFDTPQDLDRVWQSEKGTASVAVWLKAKNSRLTGEQVQGIAALISGARRSIPPENVKIVDGAGHAYQVHEPESVTGQVAFRQEQKLRYAERLARNVEELLGFLGPRVKALVDVKIDFDQQTSEENRVDPNEVVAVETTSMTRESTPVGPGAILPTTPGTAVSLSSGEGGVKESTEEKSVKSNHSVVKTVKVIAPGKVTDVSVTALVPRDGIIEQLKAEGVEVKDSSSPPEMTAKLDEIQMMVMNSLGISDRGRVVVKAVSFPKPEVPQPPPAPSKVTVLWSSYGTSAVLGVLTLVAVGMVWRMVGKPVEVNLSRGGSGLGLPSTDEELLGSLGGPDATALRSARLEEKVQEMVSQNPQDAANLIKRWVHTEG